MRGIEKGSTAFVKNALIENGTNSTSCHPCSSTGVIRYSPCIVEYIVFLEGKSVSAFSRSGKTSVTGRFFSRSLTSRDADTSLLLLYMYMVTPFSSVLYMEFTKSVSSTPVPVIPVTLLFLP